MTSKSSRKHTASSRTVVQYLSIENPLNDYVLIEIMPDKEYDGDVFIPEAMREEQGIATVRKVSPDLKLNIDLTGKKVMYKKGQIIKLSRAEDEKMAMCAYRNLMAVL